jgi:hypothetical protein
MQSLRIRAEIEGGCGTAEPEVLVLPKDCATQKSVPMRFFKILRQSRVIHARMEIKSEFINSRAEFGNMKKEPFSFWVLSPA